MEKRERRTPLDERISGQTIVKNVWVHTFSGQQGLDAHATALIHGMPESFGRLQDFLVGYHKRFPPEDKQKHTPRLDSDSIKTALKAVATDLLNKGGPTDFVSLFHMFGNFPELHSVFRDIQVEQGLHIFNCHIPDGGDLNLVFNNKANSMSLWIQRSGPHDPKKDLSGSREIINAFTRAVNENRAVITWINSYRPPQFNELEDTVARVLANVAPQV